MRLKERIPPRNESSTQLAFYVITGICMINFKEHGCTIARVDLSCKVCILLVVLGVEGLKKDKGTRGQGDKGSNQMGIPSPPDYKQPFRRFWWGLETLGRCRPKGRCRRGIPKSPCLPLTLSSSGQVPLTGQKQLKLKQTPDGAVTSESSP